MTVRIIYASQSGRRRLKMRERLTYATVGLLMFALLFILSPGIAAEVDREEGFVALFNGRDFTGWEGNLDHFRIEDGAIVAGSISRGIPPKGLLADES